MVAVGRTCERLYYCQNRRDVLLRSFVQLARLISSVPVARRFSSVPVAQTSRLCIHPLHTADVSAILTDGGSMVEWVKYSAYGVPFALPAGDTDSDGDWDADDKVRINGGGAYDVRKDPELDGDIDAADVTHANSFTGGGQTLGRGVLSSGGVGGAVSNRRGYAGYEYAPELEGTGAAGRHLYHVRHRLYDADMGRWTRRDPLGYVDGMGLYEYVMGMAVAVTDVYGLSAQQCNRCAVNTWPSDCAHNVIIGMYFVTDVWRPRDYCHGLPDQPRCLRCADDAEAFASLRHLVPGGPCYDLVMRAYMQACGGIEDPTDRAIDVMKACRQATQVNGCGSAGGPKLWDTTFTTPCCLIHDGCYGTCGASKTACDTQLYICIAAECAKQATSKIDFWECHAAAILLHRLVKHFGAGAFFDGQRLGCAAQ